MNIAHKLSLPCLAALALPASAASYTSGHGDIGIGYEDEGDGPEFHFHYHLENAIVDGVVVGTGPDGEEFEPDEITVVLPMTTMTTLGSLPALNTGTGVLPGESIWILSAIEQADAPFLGIATEELVAADWSDITFSLLNVNSPSNSGDFSVWTSGDTGGFDFRFSTADEAGTVNGDNTLVLPAGTHAHYSYGFSEPGTWELDLMVSGTHNVDGPQTSTERFTFNVIPEPSSALLLGLGGLTLLRRRRV